MTLFVVIVIGLVVIGLGALLKSSVQQSADQHAERKARGLVPRYKRSSAANMGATSGFWARGGSSDGGFGGHDGGGSCGGFDGGGSGGGDSGGGC